MDERADVFVMLFHKYFHERDVLERWKLQKFFIPNGEKPVAEPGSTDTNLLLRPFTSNRRRKGRPLRSTERIQNKKSAMIAVKRVINIAAQAEASERWEGGEKNAWFFRTSENVKQTFGYCLVEKLDTKSALK